MFNTTQIHTIEELLAEASRSKYEYKLDRIKKAYEFADEVHSGEIRKSGNPVTTHLLTTAAYIIRLTLDTTSVEAALLHETIDSGKVSVDELDELFGTEVAFIVDGQSNLKGSTSSFKNHNEDPSSFRNLVLNATEDIRILIVRLANKLHNTMSWDTLTPERKLSQAYKTLYVYAPLCEYLGLGNFLEIFEDRTFKEIEPEDYQLVTQVISELKSSSEHTLDQATAEIKKLLEGSGVTISKIQYRTKNPLSLYRKVRRKYLDGQDKLSKQHITKAKDLLGIRLILDSVEQCYIALGLIHSNYDYDQDEFDDYILKPKASGYKSIHTVIEYEGITIEIQIRTQAMHEFNEYGPASHILYKQGGDKGSDMTWTKGLMEWQGEEHINKDKFKIKAFANSVFVFTPEGKVIRLESGSTPLDFAFQVHTDIGFHYAGAKINGIMKSMEHKLKTGDIVEVLTTHKQTVNWSWLDHCQSSYTKARIRKKLRG